MFFDDLLDKLLCADFPLLYLGSYLEVQFYRNLSALILIILEKADAHHPDQLSYKNLRYFARGYDTP